MLEYVLTLLAAAAVTYLLTPLVRRFAMAVGAMHAARDRDVHVVPTPLLGGFAMYAGLIAGLLVSSRLPVLNSAFAQTNMAKGLLLAGGLIVVMGFVDDRWGMGALSKLAGQVAAGVILVWSGAEVTWLPAPGGGTLGLTSDQQTAVTILVVVMTINAVNFIDGLDGLAAGIVGIGAGAFFIYYYTLTHRLGLPDQTGPALASAVLAGMCLGFLPHNFHPARIFMGDTGSMLIGLLLAYAPISSLASLDPGSLTNASAYASGTVNRFGAILPLLLPAAILLIPYADLLMAVVRRTRAGMSPFAPDRQHLHHRLLAIGHSHRASVLIMYLWAALFSGSVVWLSILRTPLFVLATVTVLAMLALLLVSMPRLRLWSRPAARAGAPSRRAARGAVASGGPAVAPGAATTGLLADGFLPTPPAYAGTPCPPAPTSSTAWLSAAPAQQAGPAPADSPSATQAPSVSPTPVPDWPAAPAMPSAHVVPAASSALPPSSALPSIPPAPAGSSVPPAPVASSTPSASASAQQGLAPVQTGVPSPQPGMAPPPAFGDASPRSAVPDGTADRQGSPDRPSSRRKHRPTAGGEPRTAPERAAPQHVAPQDAAPEQAAAPSWPSGVADGPIADAGPLTEPQPAAGSWQSVVADAPLVDAEPTAGARARRGSRRRPSPANGPSDDDAEPVTGSQPVAGSWRSGVADGLAPETRPGTGAHAAGPQTGAQPGMGLPWSSSPAAEPAADAKPRTGGQPRAGSTWYGLADEPQSDAEPLTEPQTAAGTTWFPAFADTPSADTPTAGAVPAGAVPDEAAQPGAGSPWLAGLGDELAADADPAAGPRPAATTWFSGLGSPGEYDVMPDGDPLTGPLPPAGTGEEPAWRRSFGLGPRHREPPRARPFTNS